VDTIGAQAKSLFDCLQASGKHFVVIAPNNDPGTEDIFEVIQALPKERFRLIPSMRFNYFSELMKNAAVMVGNSSAGVREAPFLGLPSLDVGTRQNNRAQSPSLHACAADDTLAINRFLNNDWCRRWAKDEGFGGGNAALHFLHALKGSEFWAQPVQKVFAS
ncbi:MAG: UDP-N-acetyl-D-glucosamine 2-epimerase, UDP-hydrolyzing, partial [Pseudomonadota bacterium]